MTASRNRFSLTLPLSSEGTETRKTNTPPSPSRNSLSSATSSPHSTPTKKTSALDVSAPQSPLLTPRSCFEDDPDEASVEHTSLFGKARQFTRVFTKSPKHDTTSPLPSTSDQGIDYARYHALHTSATADSEAASGLPVPLTSGMNGSSRPTTASTSRSVKRSSSKRSLSNMATDEPSLQSPGKQSFKFARHLGENIPPESRPSSSSSAKASTATGRMKKSRRRKSLLDLASFSSSSISSKVAPIEYLPSPAEHSVDPSIKRSRSLWEQPRHVSHDSFDATSAAFQARYWQNFGNESPLGKQALTARQRALNVKRARKMAQVFGDEPPPELYQIADRGEEDELGDNRDSIVTAFSLSSTYLLSLSPQEPMEDSDDEDKHLLPPSIVEPAPARRRPECDDFPDSHPTPPPFSSLVEEHNQMRRVSTTITDHNNDHSHTDFQERRKRAAKLSRFFGVGYHEFTKALSALPPPPAPAPEPVNTSSVEIQVSHQGWFWESGHDKVKQADVSDVIGKLRELR